MQELLKEMENNIYYTATSKLITAIGVVFLILATISCSSQTDIYHIDRIQKFDDGGVCIYVSTNDDKGIIILTNEKIDTTGLTVINSGKSYRLQLEEITKNFRGENDKYVVFSESGKAYTIWKKEYDYPLKLFKALNLNGVYLKKE